jgi:phosphate/sulfate permease
MNKLKYVLGYVFSVITSFFGGLTVLSLYYAFNALGQGNNLEFILFTLIISPLFGVATLCFIRKFYESIYEIDRIFGEKD